MSGFTSGPLLWMVAHMEAGQAWRVDIRVKTFVQQAASRLDFLRTQYGFTGPEAVPDETGVYLLLRRVRYKSADFAFEISLVFSYMGEEYVATDLVSEDDSASAHRTEIGSSTAHTGYQMRRAWTSRPRRCGENSASECRRIGTEPYLRQMPACVSRRVASCGLVDLVNTLLQQFLGTIARHPEVEPRAVTPGAWPVQANGSPGEHAGEYLRPSCGRPDPEGEHHRKRCPPDDEAVWVRS